MNAVKPQIKETQNMSILYSLAAAKLQSYKIIDSFVTENRWKVLLFTYFSSN